MFTQTYGLEGSRPAYGIGPEQLWHAATERRQDLRPHRPVFDLYVHSKPTITAKEKAEERGIPLERVLKVVVTSNGDEQYLCVVRGDHMVSMRDAFNLSRTQARSYDPAKAAILPSMSVGTFTPFITEEDAEHLDGILIDSPEIYAPRADASMGSIVVEEPEGKIEKGLAFSVDLEFAKLIEILRYREKKVHPDVPVRVTPGLAKRQ